jgi:AraC-like DNA-binding protein
MDKAYNFRTIDEYNAFNNHDTLHPLVSILDFSKAKARTGSKMHFGLYCIFLKDVNCGDLKYGREYYDYQAGTLVFISPGQFIDIENKVDYYQPIGHGLVGVLEKFEELLNSYFSSEKPYSIGLPSVAYCAEELHFSANYFGDLIKKNTGKSAQEYIQNKIIDVAKNKIFDSSKTVNEIAYELGFKYPQHFIRLFKKRVGSTPIEYRVSN